MIKSIFQLSVLALCLLVYACTETKKADTVKSEEIYQRYTCDYNPDGSGKVKAEFLTGAQWDRMENEKTGGATVDFGDKAVVTCNGQAMKREESSLSGVYYTAEFAAGTSRIELEWTDKEGNKYANVANIYPFELIKAGTNCTINDQWKVDWNGSPVQAGERVVVQIEGKVNGKNETASSNVTDEGVNYITFSKEMMKQYNGASIKVSAWREQYIRLEKATQAEGTLKMRGDGGSFYTKLYFGTNSLF